MGILKPLKGEPLTFWHVGGDILYRGLGTHGAPLCQPIDRQMADSLRDLYQDDVRACWEAGDVKSAQHAVQLWIQLTNAMDAQATWFRVVGREPIQTSRKAA